MQLAVPAFGIGLRWLREELDARDVSVRLTDTCLRELVMDADAAARDESEGLGDDADVSYADRLRQEIAVRAEFLRAWTRSDRLLDVSEPSLQRLVAVAHKYALPRAWTLSVPMAATARHPTPTYFRWASAR